MTEQYIEWNAENSRRHYDSLGIWPEQCPDCEAQVPVHLVIGSEPDDEALLMHQTQIDQLRREYGPDVIEFPPEAE